MKTNKSEVTNAQYTLKEAVIEEVNTLKSNGSFSANEVVDAIRESVENRDYVIPGMSVIQLEDVSEVLALLHGDGTLNILGLTNINRDGDFRLYEFDTTDADSGEDDGSEVCDGCSCSGDCADAEGSPVAARIRNYIDRVGSATLKQVQGALKINGVTCKDLYDIVKDLDYDITEGTEGAYSTYRVATTGSCD